MVDDKTPYEALNEAVDKAGSLSALARLVGCSVTTVWKWVQSSKRVSPEYVLRVEGATGVSRHVLRPDIYPVEGRGSHPRWYGVDTATVLEVTPVAPAPAHRNGNRIKLLDVAEVRSAAR